MNENLADLLSAILRHDDIRQRALHRVEALSLPDCWIGAGFVRDAIWDHLHGRPIAPPVGDVDVIWFDAARTGAAQDDDLEAVLRNHDRNLRWSVKNQARMHLRNGDGPYISVADAMSHWPETATAVAVRLSRNRLEINAPFGLEDLFAMVLRPTESFVTKKRAIFDRRVTEKRWQSRYPLLHLC